jgi:DNA helicase MCM9
MRAILAPDATQHYSIEVDCLMLIQTDPVLMDWFLLSATFRNRSQLLDIAAQEAQEHMLKLVNQKKLKSYVLKPHLHCRFSNFHALRWPGLHHTALPLAKHAGRLISVRGTVIRAGTRRLVEPDRWFGCRKCGHEFCILAKEEEFWAVKKPKSCPGMGGQLCDGVKFVELNKEDNVVKRDYQECKIQENVNFLAVGRIPRSMTVLLEDDLVDSCRAGDDVVVTGTLVCRYRVPIRQGLRVDMDLSLIANSVLVKSNNGQTDGASVKEMQGHGEGMHGLDVEATNSDDEFRYNDDGTEGGLQVEDQHRRLFCDFWKSIQPEKVWEARNFILSSFAPHVFGMYPVKLAALLVLMGGVAVQTASGTRIRGESHVLLVGDPGTAKSQFLRAAAALCPTRAVLTTGVGSTNAGLTCAAVKDGGEWQLEAGALVLADRGVCCIDEFASIKKSEQASVLEAMEQQTLSVAKAGIVCKLNTRCSVLAATNPKSGYDSAQSVEVNTTLSAPLLSRFDLVMILLDEKDPDWDQRVSSFILDAECPGRSETNSPTPSEFGELWSVDLLRAYVAYCKTNFIPETTPEAGEILKRYYRLKRGGDHRDAARTTIRLLEGLIRLAQAHAKLMFRNNVLVEDAVVAVGLMESSVESCSMMDPWELTQGIGRGVRNAIRSDFPKDALAEYRGLRERIFKKLAIDGGDFAGPPDASEQPAVALFELDPTEQESFEEPIRDFGMQFSFRDEDGEEWDADILAHPWQEPEPSRAAKRKRFQI